MKLPEGYKAIACWSSVDRASNLWVNCVKTDGAIVTMAVGQDYELAGANTGGSVENFTKLAVPDGTYMTFIES